MGQKEYDNWSLNSPIEMIQRGNAPRLNDREIELIGKADPKKIQVFVKQGEVNPLRT